MKLYSWSPDRRATRGHIKEAIRYAAWEKAEIGTKSDDWYQRASKVSQQWRDDCRHKSVKALAREYLEYWRMRAHLRHGLAQTTDRPMFAKWQKFAA